MLKVTIRQVSSGTGFIFMRENEIFAATLLLHDMAMTFLITIDEFLYTHILKIYVIREL